MKLDKEAMIKPLPTLWITQHRTGKLTGIESLNVTVTGNAWCEVHKNDPDWVCVHCYARHLEKFRVSLSAKLRANAILLAKPPEGPWPTFRTPLVRFHSFGEVQNAQHLRNLYDIAASQPHIRFALWTKRRGLVQKCTIPRPENLSLVYSYPKLVPRTFEPAIPRGFDHVYVVHREGPSCGNGCALCQRCWSKYPQVIHQRLH